MIVLKVIRLMCCCLSRPSLPVHVCQRRGSERSGNKPRIIPSVSCSSSPYLSLFITWICSLILLIMFRSSHFFASFWAEQHVLFQTLDGENTFQSNSDTEVRLSLNITSRGSPVASRNAITVALRVCCHCVPLECRLFNNF